MTWVRASVNRQLHPAPRRSWPGPGECCSPALRETDMIRTHRVLALCSCLAWAATAVAQRSPESMIPPESQRPPENRDVSATPSSYDQVTRAIQTQAAERARLSSNGSNQPRPASAAEIEIG